MLKKICSHIDHGIQIRLYYSLFSITHDIMLQRILPFNEEKQRTEMRLTIRIISHEMSSNGTIIMIVVIVYITVD